MKFRNVARHAGNGLRVGLASLALVQFSVGVPVVTAHDGQNGNQNEDRRDDRDDNLKNGDTRTPIKHVIVIIGENRSFDHVFATYEPTSRDHVWNLLSEGIIKKNGTPGPNFEKAHQLAATDSGGSDPFLLSPPKSEFPKDQLPVPLAGGPPTPFITSIPEGMFVENGLAPEYYQFLITGGTGLAPATPDTRIENVDALPAGPFQLTHGMPYDAYAASPVHRFYQMWQQLNCSAARSTFDNPSGCNARLFSWVETTVGVGVTGSGTNGVAPPANFATDFAPNAVTTGEGSTALGFYNVQNGDVPYFKSLADTFTMSDNFHQSVNGGTGTNHIMLGHGDMIWFSDGNGHAAVPPHNAVVGQGTINEGTVDEIENPNPLKGTNNWYTEDGYGGGSTGKSAAFGGGSYSDCADLKQPGVSPIVKYLRSLRRPINPNCEAGHYYLLNNYNPGYFANGNDAFTDANPNNTVFTVPPSSTPSIGDKLLEKNISWKYYGDHFNLSVADPYFLNPVDIYCNICNPFQYDTSIMTNPNVRTAHIQDSANLYTDIANNTLPAVSFVKPSGIVDGHPASSKLDLFEGFAKKIVDAVQANPALWADTAIFITFDEGGGYYDSGYVQPLDFFGDGTRIPLLVVSRFSQGGHISHAYTDHVSILKFIERNWNVEPVSQRSRDNFPNPIVGFDNPYVPLNSPAIGDLFDMFDFHGKDRR
jgi:phospholipase C